ncbi:MAG: gentisate 1,2-dioxygenase, partial [Candidatus Binataceae bacterium]
MSASEIRFVDRSGVVSPKLDLWPSIVIAKEQIDIEVVRLASIPPPANGRRRSLIVHPNENGTGLAPGIQVALDVLKPGERTRPIRHNSSQVNFCIRGRGHAIVNARQINFEQYDVWNTPSFNA